MNRDISNALLYGLRMFIMASVFLGPIAGLAVYKTDPRSASKGAGFVLLMSLQRGAVS